MQPMWHPEEIESYATIAELAEEYTSQSRAFVVYKNGTVVFSDTASPRMDGDYEATLLNAVRVPPSFNVREMQRSNFLVRFDGPVTGIVVGEFYRERQSAINHALDEGGLLPSEIVLADTDLSVPREHYYVGLYARAKLYCDVSEPRICVRFAPEFNATRRG